MEKLKKISVLICAISLLWCNTGKAITFEDVQKSDLYPAEYSLSVEMNPDENRDWATHEISNGLKWKFKNKFHWLMPDSFKVGVDYAPNKKRDWRFSEITGGATWNLK